MSIRLTNLDREMSQLCWGTAIFGDYSYRFVPAAREENGETYFSVTHGSETRYIHEDIVRFFLPCCSGGYSEFWEATSNGRLPSLIVDGL